MKAYIVIIAILTVIITVYDKYAAKKLPRCRVPEKVLFLLAFIGGAIPEYITMQIIRHKTRHKKFMAGLPLIAAVHIFLIVFYLVKF